jgi:hypothetical protein
LIGAFAVSFFSSVLAGMVQDLWHLLSPATLACIGLGLVATALYLSRERR